MEPAQGSGQPKTVLKKRSAKNNNEPAAKRPKASSSKIEVMQSLKQGMIKGHGLHCGYYALWHALCALDPALKNKRCNQKSFFELLKKWENTVRCTRFNQQPKNIIEKSKFALGLMPVKVNNLEPNELDLLIEKFGENFVDQITVIPSVNYLEELSHGGISNEKLFARIAQFKECSATQVLIINTGTDKGKRITGTNHWMAIALSVDQEIIKLSIYDSGYVPDKGTPERELKYRSILDNIYKLFVVQDIALVQARTILNDTLASISKYLEAATQDPKLWAYVSMLEDYCFELYVVVLEICDPNNPLDQQKKISIKKDLKRDARESFGMNAEESSGVIHQDYVEHILTVTIPGHLKELKSDVDREAVKTLLFESGYAYEPGNLYALAVLKIQQAYEQAQGRNISCETFIQAAQELGLPQVIVNQALGIVPDQG